MSNIWIQETWIDKERNCSLGKSDVYETWADVSEKSRLLTSLKKQYGRIISKVYIDTKEGKTQEIGYVFQKRQKYEDYNSAYLLETWVTFHTAPPTETTTYHYA